LTLTADYFIKTNTDLLIQVPIPPSAGAISNPWVNYGKITNKGLELGLNYKDQIGDLFYNVFGTFTTVKNVVDELGTGKQQIIAGYPSHHGDGVTLTQAGYPVGSFYLIKTAGLFQTQDEINNYIKTDSLGQPILTSKGLKQLIQPNAKPGDIKFVDANHDGKIDANDRVVAGNPSPKFEYSYGLNLNWKGIDASIFFQGVYGNKIYNGLKMDLEDIVLNWNYSSDILNHWTSTNHNTNIPRLTILDKNQNNRESDRFLEDGSYLRIKTVQIGYTFSKNWITKAGFDVARIYTSFENLYTFTNYSGFNPDLGRASNDWRDGLLERGVDYGHVSYPLPRTMTCGIQLTF
jgi:hypothetical protein